MALFSSSKFLGAVAAGVVALAVSAPAQASPITFEYDFTASAGVGPKISTSSVKSLLTALDEGSFTSGGINYEAYLVTGITGTRTAKAGTSAITSLVDPAVDYGSGLTVDNFVFVDNAGFAALDDNGLGFFVGSIEYNVFSDNTSRTGYSELSTNGEQAVVTGTLREVPAPTALALLGASLLGMGFMRRSKNA